MKSKKNELKEKEVPKVSKKEKISDALNSFYWACQNFDNVVIAVVLLIGIVISITIAFLYYFFGAPNILNEKEKMELIDVGKREFVMIKEDDYFHNPERIIDTIIVENEFEIKLLDRGVLSISKIGKGEGCYIEIFENFDGSINSKEKFEDYYYSKVGMSIILFIISFCMYFVLLFILLKIIEKYF